MALRLWSRSVKNLNDGFHLGEPIETIRNSLLTRLRLIGNLEWYVSGTNSSRRKRTLYRQPKTRRKEPETPSKTSKKPPLVGGFFCLPFSSPMSELGIDERGGCHSTHPLSVQRCNPKPRAPMGHSKHRLTLHQARQITLGHREGYRCTTLVRSVAGQAFLAAHPFEVLMVVRV